MSWWDKRPRRINIVVDNESWILPYVYKLMEEIAHLGDSVTFVRSYSEISEADVSFYLGCIHITPSFILEKSRKNLVVHESALPDGRGFSPLTWQILEGKNIIPVCLLEMVEDVDAGPIVFRDYIKLEGHELHSEIKDAQGRHTIDLCLKYLNEPNLPIGTPQTGTPTFYRRRYPKDSRLDPKLSLEKQFNLLRVVDNVHYPAFFEMHGCKYYLKIEKNA